MKLKYYILFILGVFLSYPSNMEAVEKRETKCNELVTLMLEEYDSKGKELKEKIKSNKIVVHSYTWSELAYMTYRHKTYSTGIVSFSKAGVYNVTLTLRYSEMDSQDKYTYVAEWEISVKETEPISLTIICDTKDIEEGTSVMCTGFLTGGSAPISWKSEDANIIIEPLGNECRIYGIEPGIGRVVATTENGLVDYVDLIVKPSFITQKLRNGLYLISGDSEWLINDSYIFSKIKEDLYVLYLSCLPEGEYKLSSKDGDITFGLAEQDNLLKSLIVNGSVIKNEIPRENVKLTFNRTSFAFTIEPIFSPDKKYHSITIMTDEKASISHMVEEGKPFIFSPVFLGEEPEFVSLRLFEDENLTEIPITHIEGNDIFFTPPVLYDMTIKYILENPGKKDVIKENKIQSCITQDGIKLIGLLSGVSIDIFDIKGVKLNHIVAEENINELNISLNSNEVYIINLSNGQQFKVLR